MVKHFSTSRQVNLQTKKQKKHTWGYSERDIVLFTEVNWKNGVRGSMVTKPVWAIVWYGAINAHHQVPIKQHLGKKRGVESERKTSSRDTISTIHLLGGGTHQQEPAAGGELAFVMLCWAQQGFSKKYQLQTKMKSIQTVLYQGAFYFMVKTLK